MLNTIQNYIWRLTILATLLLTLVGTDSFAQTQFNQSEIVKQKVHSVMEAFQTYTVTIQVKNIGTTVWTRDERYALGAVENVWGVKQVELDRGEIIEPGEIKAFKFSIIAPAKPDTYRFQWQMRKENDWFGAKSAPVNVVVRTSVNRVKFVGQVVPSTMQAGQDYNVMVQYKNLGKTSWSGKKGYMIRSQNPTNNKIWGVDKVKLAPNQVVSPGETATIKFVVTAPPRGGVYNFQWQMFQSSLGWFGEKSPNLEIPVEGTGTHNKADFVLQELPGLVTPGPPYAVYSVGQNFVVKMIFKNSGTSTWTPDRFWLGSQKPANNLTWLIDRVTLNPGEEIKPGQFKTFIFNAAAPSQPGIYDFQWQLYQDGVGWFGVPSPVVKITVK
jgi:hypothetical protein